LRCPLHLFFFQAEDGIRDRNVTGVQTCALPILGPAPSTASYLRIDRILEAARAHGAEAIHPGYGFLSENAEFAAACDSARIVFRSEERRVGRGCGGWGGVACVGGESSVVRDG